MVSTLQIAEGESYFLGPNGAGKTTLIECMLSLITITSVVLKFLKICQASQRRNPKSDWKYY